MSPTIPLVDLAALHADIQHELSDALARVVEGSSFTLGAEVELLEQEFATYCEVAHCVGVSSGTAALTMMLLAAGIGPGDEVVVPAHTFIASALGVIHAGATPVYCDVEPDTGLIDPDAAEAAIGPRTAAVLAVHLYGQVCNMERLQAIAERNGIGLFEDAAQAHGATFRGRRAGSFGTAAAFSFYPSKNLGALGDGGAITTSDPALAERCRQLRNLGQRGKNDHVVLGFNERLDGLQAAFLRAKLPYLDEWNRARRAIALELRAELEAFVTVLIERPETPSIYHLFPIRLADRDRVSRDLAERGIATGVHYSPPLHLQPVLRGRGVPRTDAFPAAEAWAAEELSLPIHPKLSKDGLQWVALAFTPKTGVLFGRVLNTTT